MPLIKGNLLKQIHYQRDLFLLAVAFFTRIPIPFNTPYSSQRLNQANRYFPLVGIVLALINGGFFFLFLQFLPLLISLLLTTIIGLVLTGAFHEDGLADMADGLGGGFKKQQRLDIMKDSRVGTYGVVTLVSIMALRFALLFSLAQFTLIENQQPSLFLLMLVIGFSASRATAASLIFNTPYVSDSEKSKSKPLAAQQSLLELCIVLLSAALPLLFLSWLQMLSLILLLCLFRALFKHWLVQQIDGFTGDCLGAAQQLAEVIIYLSLLASFSSHYL